MQALYLFSGLGADKRIFTKLDLDGFEIHHVEWIAPRTFESMESYVLRLAKHHNIPKSGALVMGVSFGGICISELAKFYDFQKIVLISTIKTKEELPNLMKFAKLLTLDRINARKFSSLIVRKALYWFFGMKTKDDERLLDRILEDTDADFLQWAVHQILNWENVISPVNTLHIHGDADHIFPIHSVNCDIIIKDGGHFMVYNRASEISFSIRNFLL